ncbi:hypothetical protein CY35_18G060000 [Sphagnum magellanicum]|nr:hypothetical protein CY35_18G060000 [Sphagnum magellanicum]
MCVAQVHDLLSKPSLDDGIPLLVLGNKIDKFEAVSNVGYGENMGLTSLSNREEACNTISCKNSTNIDVVIDWLIKHSKIKS